MMRPQQAAKDAAVYTFEPRQPTTFFGAHAPQPIAGGVVARHFLEFKKRAQPFIITQHPQVLQSPSAAGKHQNQLQEMSRRSVSGGAARTG
jgi:hypothetical protein